MRVYSLIATAILALLILICTAGIVVAREADQSTEFHLPSWLPEIHVYLRTFSIYQNDTDFDDTEPLYDKYGQSMGYISTLFKPTVKWTPLDAITLFYELEVGDNFWSRNDANQGDATGEGRPIFRHKQFWGSVTFPDTKTGAKAGYMYLYDPTHLVLDKNLGALYIFSGWKSGSANVGVVQVPDTSYEGRDPNQEAFDPDTNGYNPTKNNFENDNFIFFADAKQKLGDTAIAKPGVLFRWDKTVVGRTLWFISPLVNLAWKPSELLALELDIATELGEFENGGIYNRDVNIFAWACQLGLTLDWERIGVRFGALVLSSDDGPNNLYYSGFIYSGFSKSPTLLLSKNDIQETYDNLDKQAVAQGAGLFLADLQLMGRITNSLSIFGIIGYGIVLEDKYLSDDSTLGLEADVGATLKFYKDYVKFTILGAALFPGKAAAALSNEIDRDATRTLWNIQGAFEISF